MGANYAMGGSPLQASLLGPQASHSPDFNADDTRLYVGDQSGGTMALWSPETEGARHRHDRDPLQGYRRGKWSRPRARLVPCRWAGICAAFERRRHQGDPATRRNTATPASLPEVEQPGLGVRGLYQRRDRSCAGAKCVDGRIAVNKPEFCEARKASGRDPCLAYHLIDNPLNPHFAALNFGDAGLRIFDIRDPQKPTEVAYFNHGSPVHAVVGHYVAARQLIYFSDEGGFKVLQIEPQVRARLRL